jgi:hypothetical protein
MADNLFDAIAKLLDPSQREYFYQRMLYFRHLRPDDELLRIVEAIGFLTLLIRETPSLLTFRSWRHVLGNDKQVHLQFCDLRGRKPRAGTRFTAASPPGRHTALSL